jgi:hypothetical protein
MCKQRVLLMLGIVLLSLACSLTAAPAPQIIVVTATPMPATATHYPTATIPTATVEPTETLPENWPSITVSLAKVIDCPNIDKSSWAEIKCYNTGTGGLGVIYYLTDGTNYWVDAIEISYNTVGGELQRNQGIKFLEEVADQMGWVMSDLKEAETKVWDHSSPEASGTVTGWSWGDSQYRNEMYGVGSYEPKTGGGG